MIKAKKDKVSRIKKCRICGNSKIVSLLNLGDQALTGVFPKKESEKITIGPLELVKCQETKDGKTCGLVQLAHTYSKSEMYGSNYGYRSSLNKLMLKHLTEKAKQIEKTVKLKSGDVILDIGSNDGSFLRNFSKKLKLVGIDPTGFVQYYPKHISFLPHFFSAELYNKNFPNSKAKVVTSIAMFYDLDSPLDFARDISSILDTEGVWITEQSYLPKMLEMNSYDTICHEHLEYYSLKQIKWIADKVGLKIIDVEFNNINGGSFSVILAKENSPLKVNNKKVNSILDKEIKMGMNSNKPIAAFNERLKKSRIDLLNFLNKTKKEGKAIMGYGASTKGNVLLQFCKLNKNHLPFIGEVNSSKFGSFTPQTLIPIIDEKELKKMKPDYLLVLPWHFRKIIIEKEQKYLKSGGVIVFPLPKLELYKIKQASPR